MQVYLYGLDLAALDTDADGLSDYDELLVYGTNPLLADTDGDGMPDGWEVANGLNPRLNDANDDLDLDGLTNLQEYQNRALGYRPNQADSLGDGRSDYERLFGSQTNRFYYDRNDRFIGADYNRGSNGFSIAYVYDGNGNLLRQKNLLRDANHNRLPDVWEFLNGLTNNASAYADADGDGWTDYQEWKAGTNPRDAASKPGQIGNPGLHIASLTLPFTPSNFVVGVGQLDGLGAEEIVIGADGNPGTNTNFLLVLTQTGGGWQTQRVDVGAFGITSLAVGQLTNRPGPAIYAGLRQPGGTGRIVELMNMSGAWQTNVMAISMNEAAFVLGVRGQDLVASLATTNGTDGGLYSIAFSGSWRVGAFDWTPSHRGLGTLAKPEVGAMPLRLLDTNGIAYGLTLGAAQGLVAYWSFNNDTAEDSSGNGNNGTVAGAVPTNGVAGRAFRFDGVDDYVRVPHSTTLDFGATNSFSVLLSFKNSVPSRRMFLLEKNDVNVPYPGYYFDLNESSPNKIQFALDGGAAAALPSFVDSRISDGQWHQIAAVVNRTAQLVSLYLDGVVVATNAISGVGSPANPSSLFLGRRDGSDLPFEGCLDEVRIYSRALSAGEVAAVSGRAVLIPEPPTTRMNNWRGSSLGSGSLRGTNRVSVFYTFADDKNTNGLVDLGDDFVTAEYVVGDTNAPLLTLLRLPIASLTTAQSYGLASVNFLNTSNEVFFTGEPDGQVFVWTATGATNPLQRQLFSAHHAGNAWHALAGVKTLAAGEGLVGLRVDPLRPNTCDVILWPPQSELPQVDNIVQTPPAAAVLPSATPLGSLAAVTVRLWDAEGNAATPYLQFQLSGTTNWQDAALTTLDGAPYTLTARVSASPDGANHVVVWNALADIGAGVTTNILLRARARDMTLLGDWSLPTPFALNTAADSDGDGLPDAWELQFFGNLAQRAEGDFDGDGFGNLSEYLAGTDPTDPNSSLKLRIQLVTGGVRMDWQGGTNGTRYLQRRLALDGSSNPWVDLLTNLPPTPSSGSYTDLLGTNAMQFYRMKVER